MKTETKQTLSQILERLPYFNIKIIFLQVHACTKKIKTILFNKDFHTQL